MPLSDTNGDGLNDSVALDLDRDGVPDPDLPLFPFWSGPADPQVEHSIHFSQFGDGANSGTNIFSEIILVNLDANAPAQVKILVKDDSGNPLNVDLNGGMVSGEADYQIPAGGFLTLRTDGVGDIVVGSATVQSDRAVGGVILFGGTAGLAGVGVSHPLSGGFVANIEKMDSEQINTGVAILNLNGEQTTYLVSLCDLDGKMLALAEVSLPPMGHLARFVDQFEWDSPPDLTNFRGLLKVTADGQVAATAIQTRPGEFATLPIAPNFRVDPGAEVVASSKPSGFDPSARLNQNLYFAQFGNADELVSQLILFNLSAKTANLRISLLDDAGDPLSVNLGGQLVAGQAELAIPPGGLRILKTDGKGSLLAGSARVQSDQALAGVILFAGGFGVAGVGSSSRLERGFLAPIQTSDPQGVNTGIAVMNLEDRSIQLDAALRDEQGQTLATARIDLRANGHTALFTEQIEWTFQEEVDFSDFRGLLFVEASGRSAATVDSAKCLRHPAGDSSPAVKQAGGVLLPTSQRDGGGFQSAMASARCLPREAPAKEGAKARR